MGWLLVSLPNKLQQLETQITRIIQNQDAFSERFSGLEKQVHDHDRRIIRLELK